MKKWIILIFIVMFMAPQAALAAPIDYAGGVYDEYEYQEWVFVSGDPVLFTGEVKISDTIKTDSRSLRYTFTLTSADGGKLSRTASYNVNFSKHAEQGQTINNSELKSYKETITIGNDKYVLDDVQFSKSEVVDNRPASDFSSGTMTMKKIYLLNKNEGKVIIDINGGSVGYENFWGNTETQLLDYYIASERKDTSDINARSYTWEGSVHVSISDSLRKSLRFADNESSLSSFSGANMKVTEQGMYSRYDFDLPIFTESSSTRGIPIPLGDRRVQYSRELSKERMPLVQRMIIPKFKDVGGNWAQEAIEQLYSCEVFSGDTQFFVPEVPITRGDFLAAVVRACDMRASDSGKKTSRTKKTAEVSPFQDVPTSDADYEAIKLAMEKGLVSGMAPGYFGKQETLNRAQAVTILIQALGFDNLAPTPGYFSGFSDDQKIPSWAKDSVYMAGRIGLVQGDAYNRFNPDQVLTRAEASVLLVKFLSFLQSDLQKDYRDQIVLYR